VRLISQEEKDARSRDREWVPHTDRIFWRDS
jgi:hypothetical protein